MGLFNNEKDAPNPTKGKGLFRTSEPVGYYIPDVDKAIEKYNETINSLQNTITGLQQTVRNKDQKINSLEIEIRSLSLEMSMIEVPSMAAAQEHLNLHEFRQQNRNNPKQTVSPFDDDSEVDRPSNIPPEEVKDDPEDNVSIDEMLGFDDSGSNLDSFSKNFQIVE